MIAASPTAPTSGFQPAVIKSKTPSAGGNNFRPTGGVRPGPLAGLVGSNDISAQSTWQQPNYISEESTQSAVNSRMGQAHMMGDQRIFQKQTARNGLGASKGTNYFAQIGQQQALAQGRADSAGIVAQDQMNNAKARLDFEFGREREAQQMALAQHAIDQSNWGQGFARQQAAATINAAQQKSILDMIRRLFD